MELNEFGHDDNAYIPVATPIDGPVDHPVDGPIEYQVEYQAPSNPMLLEAMSRPRAAGHLGIQIVASIVLQFVVVFAVMVASGESFDPEKQDTSLSLLVATVAIGLVLVALAAGMTRSASCSAASIGLSFSNWKTDCLLGIVVAIVSQLAFMVTMLIIFLAWPGMQDQVEANPERINQMLPPMHPVLLVGLITLVAFWEEAIFRGVLVTHLRRIFGSWALAVLVAGGLFGVMHIIGQEPIMAVPLAVIGVIWTLFMIWRRSIVACVVGHALFNLGQLFMLGHLTNSTPTP